MSSFRRPVYLLPFAALVLGPLQGCSTGRDSASKPNNLAAPNTSNGDAQPSPSNSSTSPPPSATIAPPDASAGGDGGSGGLGAPQVPDDTNSELTPVAKYGQLVVQGAQVQSAAGEPIILRGQGFGWDNWWPQYYNAEVVGWLRDDWCVDMVRPAMGIEPDGAYLANNAASRARIAAVVDAAIAKGVYVIIDWHAHDLHQEEAIAFFSDMAQTYGQHPNVLYEVYNEPDEETWPEVKAYAEAVGAAIREHDPDNLIIVGSPEWDQRIDLVMAEPITSLTNVLYAVHFYAATHGAWLRDRALEAVQAGIPVIVSESSGSEAAGTGPNAYDEWQAWFDFMDQNGISWIDYSVSDKAGETISVLEPGASASGGWDASQLTETGEYIRDKFKSYCQ